jgi:hypothetical protein
MSNTTTPTVPKTELGIPQFQTNGTSGNPRMASIEIMNNNSAKLTALNKVAQGGKRRRRKYGGATQPLISEQATATVTLPQVPTPIYNDISKGTAFSATAQMQSGQVTTMNQNAQAEYDSQVGKPATATTTSKGGSRKKRGGGWFNCSCGRKKRKSRKMKKTKKSRKSRRK